MISSELRSTGLDYFQDGLKHIVRFAYISSHGTLKQYSKKMYQNVLEQEQRIVILIKIKAYYIFAYVLCAGVKFFVLSAKPGPKKCEISVCQAFRTLLLILPIFHIVHIN